MRILLIHNDNLNENLIDHFDDYLLFNISNQALLNPNFSFDKEAHEQLGNHFEEYEKYDLIVLPFNLSTDNYLEFSGIQLANHIRLTKDWGHHKTPILFIGAETPSQIARLMRADILFTKGVFCTKNQTFDEILTYWKKLNQSKFEITDEDYKEAINKLVLEPPNDFDSQHNLDNEITIYLWSKKIDLELEILKKEIESGLYFKWWILKNNIDLNESSGGLEKSKNSEKNWSGKKILLIDDKHDRGWYLFFKKLLPTVEVQFLDGDYQKPEQFLGDKNIIDSAIDKITSFDPHVVLLDLRLTDTDNENDKNELTGIKILEKFRKNNTINQGIQFVSLSASDKIWNYNELLKKKVSSFIVKKTDNESTMNQTISVHRELVYRKIEEADYLKEIFNKLNNLKTLLTVSISNEEFEIQKLQLELVFELVSSGYTDLKYNNFAFHVLFQVLEGFSKSKNIFEQIGNNAYVVVKDSKVLVRKENQLSEKEIEVKELTYFKGKIDVSNRKLKRKSTHLDTYFKVMSILHIRLGLQDSDSKFKKWWAFNNKRNTKTGHGSNERIIPIDTNEIKSFICFLTDLFDHENQNERNVRRYENRFNFHSENFNRSSGNTLGDFLNEQKSS